MAGIASGTPAKWSTPRRGTWKRCGSRWWRGANCAIPRAHRTPRSRWGGRVLQRDISRTATPWAGTWTWGVAAAKSSASAGTCNYTAGSPRSSPLSIEPTLYVPASQTKDGFLQLVHTWFSPKWVIRASGPTANLNGQIRAALADVDPQLPIAHFRTVEELRNVQTGSKRYLAALFSMLAGLALLLAAVGLYALISQSIAQRRNEIGIRLAMGETARQTIAGAMRSE